MQRIHSRSRIRLVAGGATGFRQAVVVHSIAILMFVCPVAGSTICWCAGIDQARTDSRLHLRSGAEVALEAIIVMDGPEGVEISGALTMTLGTGGDGAQVIMGRVDGH